MQDLIGVLSTMHLMHPNYYLYLQIRTTDVDIMAKEFSDVKSTNTYLKMTVNMKDNVDMVQVRIKVKGSNNDEQLCTDMSFPFRGN